MSLYSRVATVVGRALRRPNAAVCSQVRHFARAKDNSKSKFSVSGRPSAIDLIDTLDVAKSDDPSVPQGPSGGKLRKSLQAKEKTVLDMATQGSLEATGEEVREILNEFLMSAKLAYAFKGVKNASSLVSISKVVCNRDVSHTTALWESSKMELFIKMVEAKHGEVEAAKMSAKIVQNIGKTLLAKEGAFRSFMMRKMDFKRVPRISFHPEDPTLGLQPAEVSKRYSSYNSHEMSDEDGMDELEGADVEDFSSGVEGDTASASEDSDADYETEEDEVPAMPLRRRR